MKIQMIDSILCKSSKKLIPYIIPYLEYQKSFWRQGPFRKVQKVYKANFLNKRTGIFLSGFLPKIIKFLNDKNISFEIEGDFEKIVSEKIPNLPRITLREDQEKLIKQIYKKQRGVILSPTGSGKTVIAAGFLSIFPTKKILFLCDSLSIISQTTKEFEKFGFDNISVLGDGKKEWIGSRIIISTIQTFSKIDAKKYCDYFDIVIVDECHKVSNIKGLYGQVLQKLLSSVKIGFTATQPKDKEKKLTLEGLLGPVIGEITIQEGVKLGIVAEPEIILISVPEKKMNSYKYQDIYQQGIVTNRIRNRLIVKIVKNIFIKNSNVLIMIKKIEHGEIIQKMAKDLYNIDIEFVQGSTEMENKNFLKDFLGKGEEKKAVICTSVWKEGVDIPELKNIIFALSGKSDILVLQSIGRGLRKTKNKNTIKIYDFVDVGKYLSDHFVKRLQIYMNLDWKIIFDYKIK